MQKTNGNNNTGAVCPFIVADLPRKGKVKIEKERFQETVGKAASVRLMVLPCPCRR